MDMVIDYTSWSRALAGGALIGIAAAMMLLLNGRIAGISGILGGLLFDRQTGDMRWRLRFVLGLIAGAALITVLRPELAAAAPTAGWASLIVAGLLVGFGTRLGSGCTSGHGVCGIARFSRRSFVATATFMGFGFLTVYLVRHVLGGL